MNLNQRALKQADPFAPRTLPFEKGKGATFRYSHSPQVDVKYENHATGLRPRGAHKISLKNSFVLLCVLWSLCCGAENSILSSLENNSPSDNNTGKSPFSQIKLISPYLQLSYETKKVPIGLWISLNKGWHSYWHYSGESGKAIKIQWALPQGGTISPFRWPLPERVTLGPLTSFGYKESFLLMSTLSLPEQKENTSSLKVRANVEWFICKELCIPLKGEATLHWPVKEKEKIKPQWQAIFDKWASHLPQNTHETLLFQQEGMYWKTSFSTATEQTLVDVFPFSKYPLSPHKPLILSEKSHQHSFHVLPRPKKRKQISPLSPLKTVQDKAVGKEHKILALFKDKNHKKSGQIYHFALPTKKVSNIFLFLLFSFLGGLLLNFMPCVLPVVFLKFSSAVKSLGQKKSVMVLENLSYSLGIIVSFLVLAFLFFLLKKGGESIGWGFQMQSPYFLLSMIFLFTFISFGFINWFTVPALPFFYKEQNYLQSFLTGVLITISATPCTAPFMGAGIGYGLAGEGTDLVLIFLFLSLGLASPYILLSFFPEGIRYIPLPGKWNHKLKHFMAFPMWATVIWLIYVLDQQRPESLPVILFCLLLLALSFWILNNMGKKSKPLTWVLLLLALGGPFVHVYQKKEELKILWEVFSLSRWEKAQEEGKPLFVHVTADWCLTCQFNEKFTFQNKRVIRFFKARNILAFKGDWTEPNKEITTLLKQYHRAGIPFYLYLPSPKSQGAILLPEILTPALFFKYTKQQ